MTFKEKHKKYPDMDKWFCGEKKLRSVNSFLYKKEATNWAISVGLKAWKNRLLKVIEGCCMVWIIGEMNTPGDEIIIPVNDGMGNIGDIKTERYIIQNNSTSGSPGVEMVK